MWRDKENYFIYLTLALVGVFWGSTFVAARYAVRQIPPITIATARFLLSLAILGPVLWAREGKKAGIRWSEVPVLAFLGLTGVFLYNIFFLYGVKYNSATDSALVIASNPILITVLSAFYLREAVTRLQASGVLISFAGVMVVITGGDITALAGFKLGVHRLLLLGGLVSWALYSVVGKKVLARLSPLKSVTYACGFGTVYFLPLLVQELRAVDVDWAGVDIYGWSSVAFLAVFATVLAFFWYYRGISRIGAARTAVFINLVPVSAMALSALLLGEQITGPRLLGSLLVVGGLLLVTYRS